MFGLKGLPSCTFFSEAYHLVQRVRSTGRLKMKQIGERQVMEQTSELDIFDNVTEEEIACLWRSIKSSRFSGNDALRVVVTGMVLGVAFSRKQQLNEVEQ